MRYVILLICFIVFTQLEAQTVVFNESPTIERMLDMFIQKNKSEETVKGWRVQIISTDDRRKMEAARSKFSQLYPNVNNSWKHLAPYYQVRAGAYQDKTKLMAFMMEIKEEFPMATPVVDDIDKTELLR